MVFEGIREYMNVFVFSIPNEQEKRVIYEFEMDFRNLFVGILT